MKGNKQVPGEGWESHQTIMQVLYKGRQEGIFKGSVSAVQSKTGVSKVLKLKLTFRGMLCLPGMVLPYPSVICGQHPVKTSLLANLAVAVKAQQMEPLVNSSPNCGSLRYILLAATWVHSRPQCWSDTSEEREGEPLSS